MLAFARETRLSETTFVQAGDAGSDYRNRIWMTTGELPFAGHPSLGTAVAVAHRRGETSARYVQRTIAGRQPCEVEMTGRIARCSMLQEPAEFLGELDADAVLAAVSLAADDVGAPPELVTTGARQVLLSLTEPEALDRARPDAGVLGPLLDETNAVTLYAFVAAGERAQARAFFIDAGGAATEDPATGSAAGPLMAYVHRSHGSTSLSIEQGVRMGRPSRLDCAVEGDRVRVGGEAVVVAEGTLYL